MVEQPPDEFEIETPAVASRRRYPRIQNPPVRGRLAVATEARLVDVSVHGIGIEAGEALRPSHRYRLTLEDGQRRVRLDATSVWNHLSLTRRDVNGDVLPVYRGGLRFEGDASGAPKRRLREFIKSHAVCTRMVRPRRRFELQPLPPVQLEAEYDFEVRSLSASGLLIEAKGLPVPPSPLSISLDLPDAEVQVEGLLVYSEREPAAQQPRTRLAIEFHELSRSAQQRISSVVADSLGYTTGPQPILSPPPAPG